MNRNPRPAFWGEMKLEDVGTSERGLHATTEGLRCEKVGTAHSVGGKVIEKRSTMQRRTEAAAMEALERTARQSPAYHAYRGDESAARKKQRNVRVHRMQRSATGGRRERQSSGPSNAAAASLVVGPSAVIDGRQLPTQPRQPTMPPVANERGGLGERRRGHPSGPGGGLLGEHGGRGSGKCYFAPRQRFLWCVLGRMNPGSYRSSTE